MVPVTVARTVNGTTTPRPATETIPRARYGTGTRWIKARPDRAGAAINRVNRQELNPAHKRPHSQASTTAMRATMMSK